MSRNNVYVGYDHISTVLRLMRLAKKQESYFLHKCRYIKTQKKYEFGVQIYFVYTQ